jgi:hypothetical protein
VNYPRKMRKGYRNFELTRTSHYESHVSATHCVESEVDNEKQTLSGNQLSFANHTQRSQCLCD